MLRKELKSSKPKPGLSESDSGLYVIVVHVVRPIRVAVGAKGEFLFAPGYYAYCGSARRNLSRRLARHQTRRKKMHWHIDYLTCHDNVRIVFANTFSLETTNECGLNSMVQQLPFAKPVPGFGSSDCACISHLSFLGRTRPESCLHPDLAHGHFQ